MTVYLVGAGPGDPGLLTVRGAEVLRSADVVVYDRLSVESLLDLAPPDAERISVGKTPGHASTPQEDINALLVERGKSGQTVVRLKGGDPFVFGRGGEEAQALVDAGVDFEVVPGISSAIAVPAYAGVPVTQRGMATSFTVVTGHERPWAAATLDWEAVARVGGTIVVLMGVATRGEIASRLIAGGLAPNTPVVAVQWGTRSEQRTVRTTLSGLGEAAVESPATIVIGAVAGLDLRWFERRPLLGRRIISTKPGLADDAVALGAEVIDVPVIRVTEPSDGGTALRAAAANASRYDWVLFTSANAVERFFAHVRDARAFGTAKVGAVGPATAAALRQRGVHPDLEPEVASGAGLAVEMVGPPCRVLFPQAEEGRPELADQLRQRKFHVDVVPAYRTVAAPHIDRIDADAIVFASPSAVSAYRAAGAPMPPVIVAIGPTTAAAVEATGLTVSDVATAPTPAAVTDALRRSLEQ